MICNMPEQYVFLMHNTSEALSNTWWSFQCSMMPGSLSCQYSGQTAYCTTSCIGIHGMDANALPYFTELLQQLVCQMTECALQAPQCSPYSALTEHTLYLACGRRALQ